MRNGRSSNGGNGDWQNETLEQTRLRIQRTWGDYPLTILIINPVNLRLVRLVGRTSITPNQITVLSFLMTLGAAWLLSSVAWSTQAIGGTLLLAAYFVDCLDGDLARYKEMKSPMGALLDPILDRFGELAVGVAITICGWRTFQDPGWLIGGLFMIGFVQMYMYLVDAMLKKLPSRRPNDSKTPRLVIKGTPLRLGAIEPLIWGQALFAWAGVAYWGVFVFGILFGIASVAQVIRILLRSRPISSKDTERFGSHYQEDQE